MRKIIIKSIGLLSVMALTGCGEKDALEDEVRSKLLDPESAVFSDDYFISEDGMHACVQWKSRNGLGGMSDWNVSSLTKGKQGYWNIHQFRGASAQCSEAGVERKTNPSIFINEVKREAIGHIQSVNNKNIRLLPDACKVEIRLVGLNAHWLNTAWEEDDLEAISKYTGEYRAWKMSVTRRTPCGYWPKG